MNIFKVLRSGSKPLETLRGTGLAREVLPELHAFVEVAVGEARERRSISIDGIGVDTLTTRAIPGLCAGASADFVYTNAYGKYRFSTVCAGADSGHAYFEMPATVKTLLSYGSKRRAVRLAAPLPLQWRYHAAAVTNADFLKGSISDLSRGGALLVVDLAVTLGALVEVCFRLGPSPPLTLLGEVIRVAKIATSGKNSAGIRFVHVDAASERAIDEFINERQTLRRQRGVV